MIYRYAAVRSDGSISLMATASSEAAALQNVPTDATAVQAPETVSALTHRYDFASKSFKKI